MEDVMRRTAKTPTKRVSTFPCTGLTILVMLMLAGVGSVFYLRGWAFSDMPAHTLSTSRQSISGNADPTAYIYYTLKESTGFVLARAMKGSSGQPLGTPQAVASFTEGFGLLESDSVLTMQLSPDGHYLAIDGARDHGEQVWMFDTQRMAMTLTPANVLGNFLHWLPGQGSHTFLYRPMLPLGP